MEEDPASQSSTDSPKIQSSNDAARAVSSTPSPKPVPEESAQKIIETPTGNEPAPENVQSVVSTPEKGGGSKLSLFIGILVFITLAIYGFVGYLYIQNNQLKNDIREKSQPTDTSATVTITPAAEVGQGEVKIVNGNVVEVSSTGETKTLAAKEDFPSTGITGFAKVLASPDGKFICFEAWPPAPEPALYIAKRDGSGLKEVSPNRKNCTWTFDSQKIVYINIPSESSPVDIFVYDVTSAAEANLTEDYAEEGFIKYYEVSGVTTDKIQCSFEKTSSTLDGTTTKGDCEINLSTLKLTVI